MSMTTMTGHLYASDPLPSPPTSIPAPRLTMYQPWSVMRLLVAAYRSFAPRGRCCCCPPLERRRLRRSCRAARWRAWLLLLLLLLTPPLHLLMLLLLLL